MNKNIIYTDDCCEKMITDIKNELDIDIVKRFDRSEWDVNKVMSIITLPNLVMAVFNSINELTVMEVPLLNFMCKPILITAGSINSYPILEKTVDYISKNANLKNENCNFVSWYKTIAGQR